MNKKMYKIEGMDCAACAALIESDLEDAGITAKCSYAKELLEIPLPQKNTSEDQIKLVIENLGYKISS